MKWTTRWLTLFLHIVLLLGLLSVTALAEELTEPGPWDGAAEVATVEALKAAAESTEVSAIKVTEDIEVTENITVDKSILVATGKKLTISSAACLTHTGEMFRYEDLELGQENFDRLAEHGVCFLYNESTGEGEEKTYYRELYGSAENAAAALLDSGKTWFLAILAGDVILSVDENESKTITANVLVYGDVIVEKNVTLQSGGVAGEGGTLVKHIYTADEFAASCGENISYTDLYIAESITVSGDLETAANILVATGKALKVAEDASLIHTGSSYRYEDLELGQANFDRLAEHGVSFLYNPTESGIYRELYGSVSEAAAAMAGETWNTVILPDAGQDADIILTGANTVTNLNIFDDVILKDGVSLTVENLTAAEGCDVIREVDTLEELKVAAQEEAVTLIRITGNLTVIADNGKGLTIDKKIEVVDGYTLSILAGEYGCDVSTYVPDGYICSPLRKEETVMATNGSEEAGNLVDDVYVVYKQISNFAEMKAAEENPAVGAIYLAGDIYTGSEYTFNKPIEIGWDESAQRHYDLNVAGIIYINAPFQRFGFEKLGRVGMANFDELSEDGVQWLMRSNETRELYGTLDAAMSALTEATASDNYYYMASLTGTSSSSYVYTYELNDDALVVPIRGNIQVSEIFACYGHLIMLDNSSLIAGNIWMGGDGLGHAMYDHAYVLEGHRGTFITHGGSSSDGGGGNAGASISTTTTKNDDGSVTTTKTNQDTGTVTETTKTTTGITGTTVTNKEGEITSVSAFVPTAAVKAAEKSGEVVTLPVEIPAAESSKDALEVKIDVPASTDRLTVEIPISDMSSGTVAILVHADGAEEIIKAAAMGESGLLVTLEKDTAIKIVDNSKEFSDVHAVNHWAEDAIDFVAAREMFNGTTETTFTPNAPTTRAQLMTVLARLDGADTSGSSLEKGLAWAMKNGISDGTNPSGTISRQQLAVMLWRYAGSPTAEGEELNFTDTEQVSDYAQEAMRWATENGILNGYANGSLNPLGTATRAHVAQMVKNFIQSGVL